MKKISSKPLSSVAALILTAHIPVLYADNLSELNAELTRIGLPTAGSADLNAILFSKDFLTFSVTSQYTPPSEGYSSTGSYTMDYSTTKEYTITDTRSLNRLFKAMKANDGFDKISSKINGNSLIRTVRSGNTGNCAGPSGGYTVSSWDGFISCLGLGQAYATASALSAINTIPALEFQFNRPTTQFGEIMRQMRMSHRASDAGKGGRIPSGGSSGADQYRLDGDFGVYFSGGGSFGKVDGVRGSSGYGMDRSNATAGFDYRFSDSIRAGILLSYTNYSSTLDNVRGNSNSENFRVSPFISITPFDNAFIDISAGYGYHQISVNRNCAGCVGLLHGNFNANEGFSSLGLGYIYNLAGFAVTGYGQTSVVGIATDGYTETGASAAANGVTINHNGAISVTTTLGSEISYAWSTPYGVMVPRVFGEWMHEYENNSRTISAQFQNGALPLAIQTGNPVRDWANLGAGAQFQFPGAISAFVNYQALVITGASNHTVEGGLRVEF